MKNYRKRQIVKVYEYCAKIGYGKTQGLYENIYGMPYYGLPTLELVMGRAYCSITNHCVR